MNAPNTIKVWDPLVRVFHWTLVAAFFTAYFTEKDLLDVHVWAGYTVLGLVMFRALWGLAGTQHARFSDFLYSPDKVLAYAKEFVTRKAPRYIGHNPLGGLMIIALLLSLLATTVSGLLVYGVDPGAGPLAGYMTGVGEGAEHTLEEIHEFFANLTLALVILHVAGVVAGSLMHRENLVRAMFTGRKPG